MTPTFKVINTSEDVAYATETGEVFLRMSLALPAMIMKIMLETINGNEDTNDDADDKDAVELIEKFIKKY